MASSLNDPMGQAILDYSRTKEDKNIIVSSEICEDDVISSAYLFRTLEDMPNIERVALGNCSGKIIDVGAGAGVHAKYLSNNGHEVSCIDISPRSVEHLISEGLKAECKDFYSLEGEKFDTILMLMNGIGISGKLNNLEHTLLKAKSLLNINGKIICDSSDIKYLYEDEKGGMWMDLNSDYYGDFRFQMKYSDQTSDWFDWLYVDFNNMKAIAEKIGLKVTKLADENDHYLVELKNVEC
jgi:SAM-dependent methyltransferase